MRATTFSAWICALVVSSAVPARADVTMLLGEPYGRLGFFSPTGHVSLYFDRICAETPTKLRRCQPGEPGVVVSRYQGLGGLDWVAIPIVPYLYAVERASDVAAEVTPQQVRALRDAYRRTRLWDLFPDGSDGRVPKGNWIELAGSTYDRRLVAFTLSTTPAQDDEVIDLLNSRPNKSRFNFLWRNCADFVREILDLYYPGRFRRNIVADLSFTTPKHLAKSLTKLAAERPDVRLSVFAISQIPGNRGQSRPNRGVLEALVKKIIYVVPLAVIQPWIPPAFVAGYAFTGRFNPDRPLPEAYPPARVEQWAMVAAGETYDTDGDYFGDDEDPSLLFSVLDALVASPEPHPEPTARVDPRR